MKIEVINQDKNILEFYVEGERHTITNVLRERLSQNRDVEFCSYRLDHPLDKRARFVVRAANPKKAIEDTIKEITGEVSEFKKAFEKTK
ncbi:MAG: DNA-directed RNA polymerase subunit L [Candidatus Diapherotrites archaeon]|nr:DNA-directed RNA polymerase subunit L [Candidatus Diapherotrites archaeon]